MQPKRSQSHTPSLEYIRSKSFETYVIEDVLGSDYMTGSNGVARISVPKGFYKYNTTVTGTGTSNSNSTSSLSSSSSSSSSSSEAPSNELDQTGRGPQWSSTSPLGNIAIKNPIKQCCSGIGGVYEISMLEVSDMKLFEFRGVADGYMERQVGGFLRRNNVGGKEEKKEKKEEKEEKKEEVTGVDNLTDDEYDELARVFWKKLGPTMEPAIYGADLPGTLFPPSTSASTSSTSSSWNVNTLDTCLQLLLLSHPPTTSASTSSTSTSTISDEAGAESEAESEETAAIPGVTSPYIYLGMWGSLFAAHTEDMNLLSINYIHAGAPKYWYAIAPKDEKRYESLMASYFPESSKECNCFLRHKKFLISPYILQKAGIAFTTTIQRAGDIMVTLPCAYHFGFNLGFNVAESTNFAVPSWIDQGRKAGVCMCRYDSVRIDVERFERLLKEYEEESEGVGYIQWAKEEVARRRIDASDASISASTLVEKESSSETQTTSAVKCSETTGMFYSTYSASGTNVVLTSLPPVKSKLGVTFGFLWVKARSVGKGEGLSKGCKVVCLLPVSQAFSGSDAIGFYSTTDADDEENSENESEVKVIDLAEKSEAFEISIFKPNLASAIKSKSKSKSSSKVSLETKSSSNDDQEMSTWCPSTIANIIDGYARVHLNDTKKSEDVWVEVCSGRLLVDVTNEEGDDDNLNASFTEFLTENKNKRVLNELNSMDVVRDDKTKKTKRKNKNTNIETLTVNQVAPPKKSKLATGARSTLQKNPFIQSSKYTGVTYSSTHDKYQTVITQDRKQYFLGRHKYAAEAARAYDAKGREIQGKGNNEKKKYKFNFFSDEEFERAVSEEKKIQEENEWDGEDGGF